LRGMDAAQMTNSILHVCEGDRKQASNRIAAGVAALVHACVVLGLGRTEDVSEDWACGIPASNDWTTRLRRKWLKGAGAAESESACSNDEGQMTPAAGDSRFSLAGSPL
jgi:hypothetical protein